MDEWRRIEGLTRKKEAEIQSLESQLSAAKAYLQALQDVLKVLPRKQGGAQAGSTLLRPGSMVALAKGAILRHGGPMHISQLLREIGKEATREDRASLSGSLSAYVRKGEIFTRPAPNQFGLVELGGNETASSAAEPPEGFGEVSEPAYDPGYVGRNR